MLYPSLTSPLISSPLIISFIFTDSFHYHKTYLLPHFHSHYFSLSVYHPLASSFLSFPLTPFLIMTKHIIFPHIFTYSTAHYQLITTLHQSPHSHRLNSHHYPRHIIFPLIFTFYLSLSAYYHTSSSLSSHHLSSHHHLTVHPPSPPHHTIHPPFLSLPSLSFLGSSLGKAPV